MSKKKQAGGYGKLTLKPTKVYDYTDVTDVEPTHSNFKMEINIIDKPLFTRDKHIEEKKPVKYTFPNGGYVTITPNMNPEDITNCVPGVFEERIFFAILLLHEWQNSGRMVLFDYRTILRLAKLSYNGRNLKRTKDALQRLAGSQIFFKDSFLNPNVEEEEVTGDGRSVIKKKKIGVLDEHRLTLITDYKERTIIEIEESDDPELKQRFDEYNPSGCVRKIVCVEIHHSILDNIKNNKYKYYNLEDLISITNNVTRRLYVLLSRDVYFEGPRPFARKMIPFCKKIPLSYKGNNIYKAKSLIIKAFDELIEMNFLLDYSITCSRPVRNTVFMLTVNVEFKSRLPLKIKEGVQLNMLEVDKSTKSRESIVIDDAARDIIDKRIKGKAINFETVRKSFNKYYPSYDIHYLLYCFNYTMDKLNHDNAYSVYFDKSVAGMRAAYIAAENSKREKKLELTEIQDQAEDIFKTLAPSQKRFIYNKYRVAFKQLKEEYSDNSSLYIYFIRHMIKENIVHLLTERFE